MFATRMLANQENVIDWKNVSDQMNLIDSTLGAEITRDSTQSLTNQTNLINHKNLTIRLSQ